MYKDITMTEKIVTSVNPAAKVWLVTGCSTGFGRVLVPAILARGDNVIGTARRIVDLDYIKSLKGARALQLDVTAHEDIIQAKIKEAVKYFGRVDILVNNAGYVLSGVWEEVNSHEETLKQFETNVFGALKLTRCLLPYMRAQQSGIIFFMSSISGWHGVGAGGPYSSSKFALEGAAECLQKELKHLGIRIHLLVIGQFRTGILNSGRKVDILSAGIKDYHIIKQELAERHAVTDGKQPGNPELAAEKILDIARRENISEQQIQNLPLRIPLGSDAVQIVKKKCEETLKIMEEWGDFAGGTDFPSKEALPDYYQEAAEDLSRFTHI
ncbi:hypothetical protein B0O99DRAFT_698902 [Bisporella sp. PMI_857]|nr:hypothetical protein B0O99DRAFT_698902 [Bisporella sp. PMI_857]